MQAAAAPVGLLRRDRLVTAAGLLVLCALAWVYLLSGAGMAMAMVPSPGQGWLVLGMWWSMMIAMMAPGAVPAILLHARVQRQAPGEAGRRRTLPVPTAVFAAGYFLAWLAFSVVATVAQQWLERIGVLSAMAMRPQLQWLPGAVLVAAGAYQLSLLKDACLAHCRAPAVFLARHWRPGLPGALRLGLLHGAYCVGCCWLLMALLFVVGVMNLAWIAALSLLVVAEKTLPAGPWLARIAGAGLVAWGVMLWL